MHEVTEHKLSQDDIQGMLRDMADGQTVYVHSFGAYRQLVKRSDVKLQMRYVESQMMLAVSEADE